jgi:hypothetical protein
MASFTIGTLVTDRSLCAAMKASFEAGGFVDEVEWIEIDNTGRQQTDAYAGLNQVLNRASGEYIILCHQDLLLLDQGRNVLEQRLRELTETDPHWGVAGNAGGAAPRHIVRRITDKHGENQRVGTFPHRVMSLDENFMVVRREARLAFSRDLTGFHFYGTDICLVADILGHSAWVIDFHLKHLGSGATGAAFAESERAFRQKWSGALRDRAIQTPSAFVTLSGHYRPRPLVAAREAMLLRIGRLQRSLDKRRSS